MKMLNFLAPHWGSILIGAIIVIVVALVIVKMYRDHKKGKSSCGCGCSNCPSAGMCHKGK